LIGWRKSTGGQAILRVNVCKENSADAVGHQQWPVHRVKEASHDPKQRYGLRRLLYLGLLGH
jgi:hypothetical protein